MQHSRTDEVRNRQKNHLHFLAEARVTPSSQQRYFREQLYIYICFRDYSTTGFSKASKAINSLYPFGYIGKSLVPIAGKGPRKRQGQRNRRDKPRNSNEAWAEPSEPIFLSGTAPPSERTLFASQLAQPDLHTYSSSSVFWVLHQATASDVARSRCNGSDKPALIALDAGAP